MRGEENGKEISKIAVELPEQGGNERVSLRALCLLR